MLRPIIASFAHARRGNVSMMFGLLIVPVLLIAGMAIDFQRSTQIKSFVQEATDAAILRAARLKTMQPNLSMEELTETARKIFDAATQKTPGINVKSFDLSFDQASESFKLDLGGSLDTSIMGAVGVKYLPLNIVSSVKLGKPPYIEVVMALDNTGSMNSKGKLSDLKDAASELVESVLYGEPGRAKVGLVPFAQYVNVGDSYKSASWMAATGAAWKGCVGSRDYPSNLEDRDYNTKKIPGLNGAPCPDALMPLTEDKDAILAAIDGMDANGWTYIPAGLVWGWRLLSPAAPFSEGMAYDDLEKIGGVKALIVLTDGKNTRAPTYPEHNSANQAQADDLMMKLCDNIKKDNIVIYSIAFDVDDANIRTLMEECATTPGHYFDPDSSAGLASTFQSITTSLRSISLSQ